MAKGFRDHKCNTAKEISSVGFCSSKNLFYFGLKLHLTALFKNNQLASPLSMKITRAATHDLIAVKNDLLNLNHSELFADRGYCDQSTKKNWLEKILSCILQLNFQEVKNLFHTMKKFILNLLVQLDNQ